MLEQFANAPRSLGAHQAIGAAGRVEQVPRGLCLYSDATIVEITALAPGLFRVGMFGDGHPPSYASEAVFQSEWPDAPVEVVRHDDAWQVSTPDATARITLDPIRISFADSSGWRFAEDDPALGTGFLPVDSDIAPFRDPLGPGVRVYKKHPPGERYFGCGERTGGLDRTDSSPTFWNIDPLPDYSPGQDNLYSSVPFLLALDGGRAWGLFLESSHRAQFDLAHECPERSWFGADGGNLIYYVFAGPSPRDVLERYTAVTGRTPLPPMWAVGNQQASMNYTTAEDFRAVARQFRERGIPCDVLHIDIEHMDGYRVFTWDHEKFPDPSGLTQELQSDGFHVVSIVDPGVKVDQSYDIYTTGRAGGMFCRDSGDEEYHNVSWADLCAFPDFVDSRVRDWWGGLHAALVEQGVNGICCDMNEPRVYIPNDGTFPDTVVHRGTDGPKLHAQVHNLYGFLMARATREGLQRLRPDRRPFVMSRSGFAGLQRDAVKWTGDNSSWWDHLWSSLPQLQGLGLSGIAWTGADVGGWNGDCNGELLTRWTEAAAFQPFCRNHNNQGNRPQEPWAFGEPYESATRKVLKLRQRLLPYFYTLFEECHRTGAPVMRPLLFEYPNDATTYALDDEFLLGDRLLVCPITRPSTEHRYVYLPQGTWFHLWSGEQFDGPAHMLAQAPLGEPAVYVRANAPVPLWAEMDYVGARSPDPVTLLLFPAEGESDLSLYEAEGDGYEYENGRFARTHISCQTSGDIVTVRIGAREGTFQPQRTGLDLELRGLTAGPSDVYVDSNSYDKWRYENGTLLVSLPESVEARTVEIRR